MGKNIGEPYDPALRQTEHGSKLYQTWRKIRKHPHYQEWEYFPTFYEWAMESGYTLGSWLRLVDKNKPYEPNNCIWYVTDDNDAEWVAKWNKTVNRIRKHYGMPPLEGTKHGD